MESWIKNWLEEKRRAGEKCLEIKMIQNKPYVYHSTSRYDPVTKKAKKISKYLGRLDQKYGLIRKEDRILKKGSSRQISIHEYGNAAIIEEEFKSILPTLEDAFPSHYTEIYALVATRIAGYVPLKRVGDLWSKLASPNSIHPDCSPKNLSAVLHEIGLNRASQQKIFSYLSSNSEQLIYDLSFIDSYSSSITFSENAYISEGIYHNHHHIALFCSRDNGLPVMIRSVPGSVNDVSTLKLSLKEIDLKNKVLLMDRGFISEDNFQEMVARSIRFIIPLKRDSIHYKTRIHLTGSFSFHSKLIHCGKRSIGDFMLYRFENEDLALDEKKTLYSKFEKGEISREELNLGLKKVGLALFLTTVDLPEQEVYELYKSRDMVEKHFDTFKNELRADKISLRSNEALFGHIFVSFICLYIYCAILNRLKAAKLLTQISPHDLLTKFSKVYAYQVGEGTELSEVPKRVRDLSRKLNYPIFPN
ncbi:transposase [Methanospirillum stamsii]